MGWYFTRKVCLQSSPIISHVYIGNKTVKVDKHLQGKDTGVFNLESKKILQKEVKGPIYFSDDLVPGL